MPQYWKCLCHTIWAFGNKTAAIEQNFDHVKKLQLDDTAMYPAFEHKDIAYRAAAVLDFFQLAARSSLMTSDTVTCE
jgi:hypothetical protein